MIKELSRTQVCELVYMALLSTSGLQFHWVVRQMMTIKGNIKSPFLTYLKICKDKKLCVRGGSYARFTLQGDQAVPKTKLELQQQMPVFLEALASLNKGTMMNNMGTLTTDRPITELQGVGQVSALSFPSLCCFVGLGNTLQAIQHAKQALVNTSKKGYMDSMCKELELKTDKGKPPRTATYYSSLWKAVASSIGEVPATMENGSCCNWRTHKRWDVFVQDQHLYNLFDDKLDQVFEKKYSEDEWEPMSFSFRK